MQKDIFRLSKNVIYIDEEDFIDDVPSESRYIDITNLMFQNLFFFINFINLNKEEEIKDNFFYRAQSQMISDTLEENEFHIKVGSTDSFQGNQKEYVIICTTKYKSNIGFVQDISRINLSIAHALNMATIFGSAKMLSNSSPY